MATCSSIVNRALRKIGRLGAGRDARQNDAEDALDALRGLYTAWVASGAFGRLADVVVNADFTASEHQRIVRPIGVTAEIILPDFVPSYADPRPYNEEIAYYEGAEGNSRPPRDGSVVVIADQATGTIQQWIYDGTIKLWRSIDDLTLTDSAPLSFADPDGLAACLAVEVSDQFGADVPQITMMAANRFKVGLTQRFSMPRQTVVGVYN